MNNRSPKRDFNIAWRQIERDVRPEGIITQPVPRFAQSDSPFIAREQRLILAALNNLPDYSTSIRAADLRILTVIQRELLWNVPAERRIAEIAAEAASRYGIFVDEDELTAALEFALQHLRDQIRQSR